jgi:uridine phosphorylase
MEAAAVLQVASQRGARAGCVLAVSDRLAGGRVRAAFDEVEEMGVGLGEAAWTALELLEDETTPRRVRPRPRRD